MARGDGGNSGGEAGDVDWAVPVGGGAVSELLAAIAPPTLDASAGGDRARVTPAGGDGSNSRGKALSARWTVQSALWRPGLSESRRGVGCGAPGEIRDQRRIAASASSVSPTPC